MILEYGSMTAIRVDAQCRVRNPLQQLKRLRGWHHHVVVTVGDKRRLRHRREPRRVALSPAAERRHMCCGRSLACRWYPTLTALLKPRQERVRSRLTTGIVLAYQRTNLETLLKETCYGRTACISCRSRNKNTGLS